MGLATLCLDFGKKPEPEPGTVNAICIMVANVLYSLLLKMMSLILLQGRKPLLARLVTRVQVTRSSLWQEATRTSL
jgi:hypothetical protein